MKIAVWDTYVQRADGKIMHFDILVDSRVKDAEKVFEFGRKYLKTKSFETEELRSNECLFCHVEQASEELRAVIEKNGFSIIEMENCG